MLRIHWWDWYNRVFWNFLWWEGPARPENPPKYPGVPCLIRRKTARSSFNIYWMNHSLYTLRILSKQFNVLCCFVWMYESIHYKISCINSIPTDFIGFIRRRFCRGSAYGRINHPKNKNKNQKTKTKTDQIIISVQ